MNNKENSMKELNYKMTLPKVDLNSADERRKPIIEDVIEKNGRLPNMYTSMINSPGLLETYLYGYDRFRKESGFNPAEQEVIFLTISYENACEYCMAAHSMIADRMSKVPAEVTDAIREGRQIEDEKLRSLSTFTRTMFITRGRPSAEDVELFLNAGYSERQILEIILALAVKKMSNYSNHLFDPGIDTIFKSRKWTK
jgi:uncharacterized peroxidase-related enzyme